MTLRHVMQECEGTPERSKLVDSIVGALRAAEAAVPLTKADVPYNAPYRKVVHEARTALEAADAAALPDAAWAAVEQVLAGCVPDFGRQMDKKERKLMVTAVIAAVRQAQAATLELMESWKKAQAGALERRRGREEGRERLRTLLLAWRELADGRMARSAAGEGRGQGAWVTTTYAGQTGARQHGQPGGFWLSGQQTPAHERHPAALEDWDEKHHRNKVIGDVVLGPDPMAAPEIVSMADKRGLRQAHVGPRSAIPAGTAARWFITWLRLTGGPERARRRRDKLAWAGRPPGWGGQWKGRAGTSTWQECVPERCGKRRLMEIKEVRQSIEGHERPWSRAHTDEEQHSSPARRTFAANNALTHERGQRLKRAAVEGSGKRERGEGHAARQMKSPRRRAEPAALARSHDLHIQAVEQRMIHTERTRNRAEEAQFSIEAQVERELEEVDAEEEQFYIEAQAEREMEEDAGEEQFCVEAQVAREMEMTAAGESGPTGVIGATDLGATDLGATDLGATVIGATEATAGRQAGEDAEQTGRASEVQAAMGRGDWEGDSREAEQSVVAEGRGEREKRAPLRAAAGAVRRSGRARLGATDLGATDLGATDLGATDLGATDLGATAIGARQQGRLGVAAATSEAARANRQARQTRREATRALAAERITRMAEQHSIAIEQSMKVVQVEKLQEVWRWKLVPQGQREQLVLFNHGERDTSAWELRAAVLESEYGRGLVYASAATRGQAIGYYDGAEVSEQEYCELNEDTGLRHTLSTGRRWVNGIHGATGMQYANTSRGADEANNAHFVSGSSVVRVSAAKVACGQPVLIPYGWTAAAWAEIESRVVGLCAFEERAGGQGLGQHGGTYILELVSTMERGGIATHMLRTAREGWGRDRGRLELQCHQDNGRARRFYEGLRMSVCRWWEGGELRAAGGGSLLEPEHDHFMMQVGAEELDNELRRRAAARGAAPEGVEFRVVTGVAGLEEAGLLRGVRAMVARIYGGQGWRRAQGRAESLYMRHAQHAVHFVVATRIDGAREWTSHGDEREEGGSSSEEEDGVRILRAQAAARAARAAAAARTEDSNGAKRSRDQADEACDVGVEEPEGRAGKVMRRLGERIWEAVGFIRGVLGKRPREGEDGETEKRRRTGDG